MQDKQRNENKMPLRKKVPIVDLRSYRKERSDWNKLSLTAGSKARLGEISTILRLKRIFNAIETHDSLKFSSWKYASNELNHETLTCFLTNYLG